MPEVLRDMAGGLTDGIADQAELEPSSPGTCMSRYDGGKQLREEWRWWQEAMAWPRVAASSLKPRRISFGIHVREWSRETADVNCVLQKVYTSQDVVQVNIAAESGEMGILANHVPSIEQLKPGLIEVVEESGGSNQFFLSGGFAVINPGSVLSINAVEGFPLEDFSIDAVRAQIGEAQKIAAGSGSAQDIAEANIELEVRYYWRLENR
jgi:F0F1-type ATP synthase epsilon subunit